MGISFFNINLISKLNPIALKKYREYIKNGLKKTSILSFLYKIFAYMADMRYVSHVGVITVFKITGLSCTLHPIQIIPWLIACFSEI